MLKAMVEGAEDYEADDAGVKGGDVDGITGDLTLVLHLNMNVH